MDNTKYQYLAKAYEAEGKYKEARGVYEERLKALLNMNSRKQRICKGSGKQIMDLNKLIRHFQQMEKMSKKFSSKEGMLNMMQMMKDKLPPEFFR